MGRPYNPLIAEQRGAKRRQAKQQASEIKKKFSISGFQIPGHWKAISSETKIEKRVLTDENVSTTTRHVDDAER